MESAPGYTAATTLPYPLPLTRVRWGRAGRGHLRSLSDVLIEYYQNHVGIWSEYYQNHAEFWFFLKLKKLVSRGQDF